MKWFKSREEKNLEYIRVGIIAEQVRVKKGLSNSELDNQIKLKYELGHGSPQLIADWLRGIVVYNHSDASKASSKIKFEDVFDSTYLEAINKANLSANELIEKLKMLKETIK